MIQKFLHQVWDELRSRFTEEEQAKLKIVVAVRLLSKLAAGFFLFVFPFVPWVEKALGRKPFIGSTLGIWTYLFSEFYTRSFMEKAKGSRYRKLEIGWFVLAVFCSMWISYHIYYLTVDEGVQAFGRQVQLPAYVPFAVHESEAEMNYEDDELYISYYSDSSFLGGMGHLGLI
jgi:hypothetical protein